MEMHTTSYFLTVPDSLLQRLATPRALLVDALRGVGHALEAVAAVCLMCDPRDINQSLGDGDVPGTNGQHIPAGRDALSGQVGDLDPTLFLFDAQPGGVGLAERIYERSHELIARAHAHISACPCERGCPACVGPTESGNRKELSLRLIEAFGLGAEVGATKLA
jgi:DEAD/DEAH box helicase domain-containing protein